MNGSFRQSMRWLHTWAGLVLGGVLYFIFVTGSTGYFDNEIDRWMQPEIPATADAADYADMLELASKRLSQVAPNGKSWRIWFPVERNGLLSINWADAQGEYGDEILHPQIGQPVDARDTGGGAQLYQMHWRLHYMPNKLAYWLVSLATMFMLVALISGIIIHKKIFKDFFTFRAGKKQRSWLDMHNLLSVLPLPFHLMITYSGLIFLMFTTLPVLIGASYGTGEDAQQRFLDELFSSHAALAPAGTSAPLTSLSALLSEAEARWGHGKVDRITIDNPGDIHAQIILREISFRLSGGETLVYDGVSGVLLRPPNTTTSASRQFYDVMVNLHEGLFAGIVLRWLYFLSGLMGAAMIATGMILWTVKRRNKAQRDGQSGKGLILVECLNVGIIVGLPIAIAAYFWANRLFPTGFAQRAEWEMHTLFITWAAMLVYPVLIAKKRSLYQVWIDQLLLAAVAFSCLPLLNFLTTNKHLGTSLVQQDWVMAGFDLSMLGFGLCFYFAAQKVRNKHILISVEKSPNSSKQASLKKRHDPLYP